MQKDIMKARVERGGRAVEDKIAARTKEAEPERTKREEDKRKIEKERGKVEEQRKIEEQKKVVSKEKAKEEPEIDIGSEEWGEKEVKRLKEEDEQKRKIEEERKRVEDQARMAGVITTYEEEKRAEEIRKIEEGRRRQFEEARRKEDAIQRAIEEKKRREEEDIRLKQEKEDLEKELEKFQERKAPIETEKAQLTAKETQLESALGRVLEKETEVEKDEANTEEREKLAKGIAEKKEIETERWKVEEKRRSVERERWEWEEEISKVKALLRDLDLRYQKMMDKEISLRQEFQSITKLLGKEEEAGTERKTAKEDIKKREEEAMQRAEIKRKEAERLKREMEIEKEEEMETKISERKLREVGETETSEDEKKKEMERLKLEQIKKTEEARTRFLSQQKIKEPQKEKPERETFIKERLSAIQQKEEEERRKFLERIQGERKINESGRFTEPQAPMEIVRPVFQKPSFGEKFLSRFIALTAILAVVGGVLVLLYWLFFVKKPQPPQPPPAEIIVVPEITIPESFITIDAIKTFELTKPEETAIYISQTLKEQLGEGQFTRLIIKDLSQKKVPGLKEFWDIFQATTPENFYQKLTDEFTLFVYSQKEGKRLGLAAKIRQKEQLPEMLRLWEDTMETDLKDFFAVAGKKDPAINNYFVTTSFAGTLIRCQTFTKEDFGACYSVVGDYFVFTTSLESMTQILSYRLPK